MADIEIDAAELMDKAGQARPGLRGTSRPIAVLAFNGIAPLVARQLANDLAVPLVPINPLLTPTEIAHIVSDSQCEDLIADAELAEGAEAALGMLGTAPPRLHISDAPTLSELDCLHYQRASEPSFRETDIGATLIYTSGTTGKPKGCIRTAAQEFARAKELTSTYNIQKSDIQLVACPLAHSAPGIFVRAAHAVGARSIILRRFRPVPFWEQCRRLHASFFFLVPTQYQRLLESFEGSPLPVTLSRAIVAGAPLHAKLQRRLVQWLGTDRLWQFYGSSETGTIAIAPPGDSLSTSVGKLAPGVELQIRSQKGELCQAGEVGEMYVRSKTVMSGYQGQPGSQAADNFVSVGDLGYQDEAGQVFLVDRKHDTIISGGVNVYPAEVEAALLAHEKVRAAVVVGVDDDDWGQRVVALVSVAEDCSAEALRQHCATLLARYKLPKEVFFFPLEDMPLGASGKPLRRSARAMLL